MITFECKNDKKEIWNGNIMYLKDYKNHYEMRIESRSGLTVLFGKAQGGGFACLPDYDVGCHLVNLSDKFWNTERLVRILGEIDGITVATALYVLADKIHL